MAFCQTASALELRAIMQSVWGRIGLGAGLIAVLGLMLAAGLLLCDGRRVESFALIGTDAFRIDHARRWVSPSTAWLPPAALDTADDGVAGRDAGWSDVALPDARLVLKPFQRSGADYRRTVGSPSRLPMVVWYRMDLDAVPGGATGLRQIYLARISSAGSAAIYVDGRLVWQVRPRHLFAQIYEPVLINLDTQPGTAHGPHHIYVRLSSQALDGYALASLWVSHAGALIRPYELRSFLQVDILNSIWVAYRAFGVLSLAIWARRRRSADGALYLNFAAVALFVPAFTLPDIFADQPWTGEEFSLWLMAGGSSLLLMAVIHFFAEATGCRQPPLERVARWFGSMGAIGASAYMLYWHGRQSPSQTAYGLIIFPILNWLYFNLYTFRAAAKFRTWTSLAFLLLALVCSGTIYHDLRLIFHINRGEDLYFLPFTVAISFVAYLFILLRAYVNSMVTAERAGEQLRKALTAKEAELALSHRQLMLSQREQTLSQERQRMMREMHDGIGASLVSALRFLQHGQKDPRAVTQVLEECIDDLKLSLDSLEPVAQDLLLLLASLRFRLGARLQGSGITLHWDVSEVPALAWLDAPSGMHILRILQEILTNLLKHSGADTIRLSTGVAPREARAGVVICIEDNGRAFTLQTAGPIPLARKGLGNIISRTQALKGHCQWDVLATGNRFTLWLPQ